MLAITMWTRKIDEEKRTPLRTFSVGIAMLFSISGMILFVEHSYADSAIAYIDDDDDHNSAIL